MEHDLKAEPALDTAPKLLPILKQLAAREPLFHRSPGATRADFEAMTDADFREVGASGRRYSRDYVLSILEARMENPAEDVWQTKDFHCLQIAPANYLLTYTLTQGDRVTRRATLWRRTKSGWKVVFHQGTVVQEAPQPNPALNNSESDDEAE